MDVMVWFVVTVVLLPVFLGISMHLVRTVDSRAALRHLDVHGEPIRRITPEEREAIAVVFGVDVAADAPIYRVQGPVDRHQMVVSGGHEILQPYVGSVRIATFHGWERFIAAGRNRCEFAIGPRIALPVALNGIGLPDIAATQIRQARVNKGLRRAREGSTLQEAKCPGEPPVVLGALRLETPAEATLRSASVRSGVNGAVTLGLGCAMLVLAAALQRADQPLLVAPALVCIVCGGLFLCLGLFSPPSQADIRTLHGNLVILTRTRRGRAVLEARIANLEVRYPDGWLPHLLDRQGQICEVDVALGSGAVVRHERLSLYEERRRFPVPRWGWHLAMVIGAAITLLLSLLIAATAPPSWLATTAPPLMGSLAAVALLANGLALWRGLRRRSVRQRDVDAHITEQLR